MALPVLPDETSNSKRCERIRRPAALLLPTAAASSCMLPQSSGERKASGVPRLRALKSLQSWHSFCSPRLPLLSASSMLPSCEASRCSNCSTKAACFNQIQKPQHQSLRTRQLQHCRCCKKGVHLKRCKRTTASVYKVRSRAKLVGSNGSVRAQVTAKRRSA